MEDRWFCDLEPSERWPHYTRANAGEVLAPPASPLGQTFVWDNGTFLGWRDGYIRQGYFTEGEITDARTETGGFFGNLGFLSSMDSHNPESNEAGFRTCLVFGGSPKL